MKKLDYSKSNEKVSCKQCCTLDIESKIGYIKGITEKQIELIKRIIDNKHRVNTEKTEVYMSMREEDIDGYLIGLRPDIVRLLKIIYEQYYFYPRYKVCWENQSDEILDFVIAYETKTGLVDVLETKVFPHSTGFIYSCPCGDMKSYAWSAWTQDNIELGRSPTVTPEEVNEVESVYKECEDTWQVRVNYS